LPPGFVHIGAALYSNAARAKVDGMSNELLQNAPSGEAAFIDEKELLKRLPVSRRTLFSWRTTGKIPFVRLGGRRVLFHWPSIEAALLRKQNGGEQ
jgi:predicted DNA-binding transcriptional regulator AlpA